MNSYAIDYDKIVGAKREYSECVFCGSYKKRCYRVGSLLFERHLRANPGVFTHKDGISGFICLECLDNNAANLEKWRTQKKRASHYVLKQKCNKMNAVFDNSVLAADLVASLQDLPPGARVTFCYQDSEDGTTYAEPDLNPEKNKIEDLEYYTL